MVSIDDYRLEYKDDGTVYIESEGARHCPVCDGLLKYLARRLRKLVDAAGETVSLLICRLRCCDCRRIHHELPDCIVPYKRHCAETVETIVTGRVIETTIEESTINRIRKWWTLLSLYFASVLASLTEKYGVLFSKDCAPREIVRAVVNANLWAYTRSAFLSG